MVKDELQALQLACTTMEENYRKVQEENQELVSTFERDRWQLLQFHGYICITSPAYINFMPVG